MDCTGASCGRRGWCLTLCNPFETDKGLWVFLGITLIVETVVDAVTRIFRLRAVPEAEEEAENAE